MWFLFFFRDTIFSFGTVSILAPRGSVKHGYEQQKQKSKKKTCNIGLFCFCSMISVADFFFHCFVGSDNSFSHTQ